MSAAKVGFTLTFHKKRKLLGLTRIEYEIADSIYHLSNNPRSLKPGWCQATKKYLAEFSEASERSVFYALSKLKEKGLIVVDQENEQLMKTTEKWYDTIILDEEPTETLQKLQSQSAPELQKLQSDTAKIAVSTSGYNNSDNNIDIRKKDCPTDNGKKENSETEQKASSLVVHFQNEFGRKGGGLKVAEKGLQRWGKEYSLDEIKQAITVAAKDPFWKNKMTLELLFRYQKAKDGGEIEYVDRIGSLLARPKIVEKVPLSPLEIWQIAGRMNVNYPYVAKRYKNLEEFVADGSKYPDKTMEQSLVDWLNYDLKVGYVEHCNEMEALDLPNYRPDKIRERNMSWIKADMFAITQHKHALDSSRETASEEKKIEIDNEIKDLASKMRQLKSKLEEYEVDNYNSTEQGDEKQSETGI